MIQFTHVSKSYDASSLILHDLSFQIEKAEFIFLTGVSGAGKTTLLKMIFMEEQPTSGSVFVCGFDSKSMTVNKLPFLRRKLGIVFQDFRLLNDRNIFENVAFTLRVIGKNEREIKRKVFEVLSLTGLSHKCFHFPHQLSGGEQQRVAIARAIVNDPWVLLADEPTGNLDISISRDIFNLLQIINSWGTTVLMSTHDLSLIEPYHYRHLILSQGRLVAGNDITCKPKTEWRA
jgi:cell division transport system ATP-binding protein